jgi:hypothetical protein
MSLTNSRMQPLISMYEAERLDKWEILFSRYGVWGAFLNETDRPGGILSPKNKKSLYNSWGNTVPIVTLVGDTVTIGSTYSCSIPDQENTSNKITPTFTQYAWGWTMYPGQYATGEQAINYVQYQEDFEHKANEFLLALMTVVDTASRNILETNKNVYWTANVANYYATTGDALQISQAQKNDSFNQLSSVMKEMDLYEECLLISSTSLNGLTKRLVAQGEGNAINERFQFQLGNFTFMSSNRVTNGTGIQSTAYMCQPGSIAVFNRNNPDARAHNKIGGGATPVVEWNELMLPRLDMVVGTYYAATCAAAPAATNYLNPNLSAALQESFGFNTEIGWLTAAQGNSSPSTKVVPIVKAEWSLA